MSKVSSDPYSLFHGPLFAISAPEITGQEARVAVNFKNMGKATRVEYVLSRTADGWKISDIRYDDGSSLKKILQAPL